MVAHSQPELPILQHNTEQSAKIYNVTASTDYVAQTVPAKEKGISIGDSIKTLHILEYT